MSKGTGEGLTLCVALCTYQGAAFLEEQLASIAAQTRAPDSMVLVDDGSADVTLEIARSFASRAPFPMRVIQNAQNLGFVRNFEKAIGLAEGDVIVLADQDDVWREDKLARIEQEFVLNAKVGMVFSDALLVGNDLSPQGVRLSEAVGFDPHLQRLAAGGRMLEVLLRGDLVTGATMAFRSRYRSLLLPIAPDTEHDAWIALLLSAVSEVRYIAEPLVLYRQHGANQIGARVMSLRERILHARRQRTQGLARRRGRSAAALVRLQQCEASPATIELLREGILHLDQRATLPAARYLRAVPILRELASGRYRRLSKGVMSAFRDWLA